MNAPPIPIGFICCFWGDWHRNTFITGALPTLILSPAFKDFLSNFDCKLYIATTQIDYEIIKNTEVFQQLKSLLKCDITHLDKSNAVDETRGENDQAKADLMFSTWTHGLNKLISLAGLEHRNYFFLHPDNLYNCAFFRTAESLILNGKKLLGSPSLRINDEPPAQCSTTDGIGTYYHSLSHKEKIGFSIECMSRFHQRQFPLENDFTQWPSSLLFRISNESFILRSYMDNVWFYCTHEIGHQEINVNFDADYDKRCFEQVSEKYGISSIGYIDNYDDGFMLSLTPKGHYTESHLIEHGGFERKPPNETLPGNPIITNANFRSEKAFSPKERYSFSKSVVINPTHGQNCPTDDQLRTVDNYCQLIDFISCSCRHSEDFTWIQHDKGLSEQLKKQNGSNEKCALELSSYLSSCFPELSDTETIQLVGANNVCLQICYALSLRPQRFEVFDTYKHSRFVNGIEIRRTEEIRPNRPILVCSINAREAISKQLEPLKQTCPIFYLDSSVHYCIR